MLPPNYENPSEQEQVYQEYRTNPYTIGSLPLKEVGEAGIVPDYGDSKHKIASPEAVKAVIASEQFGLDDSLNQATAAVQSYLKKLDKEIQGTEVRLRDLKALKQRTLDGLAGMLDASIT